MKKTTNLQEVQQALQGNKLVVCIMSARRTTINSLNRNTAREWVLGYSNTGSTQKQYTEAVEGDAYYILNAGESVNFVKIDEKGA